MRKYEVIQTSAFKRDLKAIMKRGYDASLLEAVVDMVAATY